MSVIAILPVTTGADNPVLRMKTKKVTKVTKELLKVLKDMEETTESHKGAGIAAPQVGRTERMCIALIQKKLVPLINPVITWFSEDKAMGEEGCLSLPDVWLEVPRSREIIVQYMDETNQPRELKLKYFDARVVQHEVDHLDGVLIVDYLDKGARVSPQPGSRPYQETIE